MSLWEWVGLLPGFQDGHRQLLEVLRISGLEQHLLEDGGVVEHGLARGRVDPAVADAHGVRAAGRREVSVLAVPLLP